MIIYSERSFLISAKQLLLFKISFHEPQNLLQFFTKMLNKNTPQSAFFVYLVEKKKEMGTPSWRVAVESWLLWIINRTKYYDFCRGHKTLAFISIKLLTFVVFEKMVILEIAEVIWPYLPTIYSLSKAIENAEIIQIIGDIFPTSTDYYRIWKRLGYVMKEKFSCSYHKGDPYIIWLVYILSLTRIVFYSYFHVELR